MSRRPHIGSRKPSPSLSMQDWTHRYRSRPPTDSSVLWRPAQTILRRLGEFFPALAEFNPTDRSISQTLSAILRPWLSTTLSTLATTTSIITRTATTANGHSVIICSSNINPPHVPRCNGMPRVWHGVVNITWNCQNSTYINTASWGSSKNHAQDHLRQSSTGCKHDEVMESTAR